MPAQAPFISDATASELAFLPDGCQVEACLSIRCNVSRLVTDV
jgi:hypothetical protein